MPEPLGSNQRYMPGLDGLRAVAVLAVIAYLEFAWAQGGLLGVGVFFTLSGYLITDILLARLRRGSPHLGRFWLARARRLLPALFLMLAVVATWVAIAGPAQPPQFGQAIAASALYVGNWQLIFEHVSYFARFGPPSPLGHLWSLGVEEQFDRDWSADLAHERVLPVSLPRRIRAAVARDRLRDRGAGASRLSTGPHPRLRSAALDRNALLRHLPVEHPHSRAEHADRRPWHRSRA
jgi:peptidoglycan/LPS O-acetylase OafA/YrhL